MVEYARTQTGPISGVLGLTLVGSVVALLQPWPMQILIDHILGGIEMPPRLAAGLARLPGAGRPDVLAAWVAGAGLAIWVLSSLIENGVGYLTIRLSHRMTHDASRDLFADLQRRSLQFHSRRTVGDSMTRVVTDTWCIAGVVDKLILTPVPAVIMIAVMGVIMAGMDARLTLVAMLAAPMMAGAAVALGRFVRTAARAHREVMSRVQSHVHQTLSGIHVVQAFGREGHEQGRFQRFADAAIHAQQRSALLKNVSNLGSGLIATVGTAVVLWIGARHVLDGTLSLGRLLVFLSYLHVLQGKMKGLARCYTELQGLAGQIDRVLEILESESEVRERPGASALTRARGHVRFENVTFGYEPDRPVLHNITLKAAPGERIAIIGPSGAGKSTLVSLIPRFFDPGSGRVTLDGHDLRDLRLRDLRSNVAVVLQEPFLFPISIAENIAYGQPQATRDEVEAAARAANADEFIRRLPNGYDTVIGERGATLSGGERQRLAVARALLKDAPILILDEPTSAVDSQTEALLVEALQRLMRDRTTFIIAHRLSTVRHVDRIVVIEHGRIVESGTHEELRRRGGIYARMCELQTGQHDAAGNQGVDYEH